jgi:hypothetical protein
MTAVDQVMHPERVGIAVEQRVVEVEKRESHAKYRKKSKAARV